MHCTVTFGLTVSLHDWTSLRSYAGHTFEHLRKLLPPTLTLKHNEHEMVWNPNPNCHNIYLELLKILEYLPGRLAQCYNHLADEDDLLDYRSKNMTTRRAGSVGLGNVLLHWKQAMAALKVREMQETPDYACSRLHCLRDEFGCSFRYDKYLEKHSPSQLIHAGLKKGLEKVEDYLEQLKKLLDIKSRCYFYHECGEFLQKADYLRWALHLCCRFGQPMLIGSWLPITSRAPANDYGKLMDDYYTYVEAETLQLRDLSRLFNDHVFSIATKSGEALKTAQNQGPETPLSEVSDDDDDDETVFEYGPEHNRKRKKTEDPVASNTQ